MKDGFNKILENQSYLQYQINFQNEVAQKPMWKANATGQCIFANEAYCRLFDMEFSELRGDGWLNTIAESNLDRTLRLWQNAINAKTQSYIEYEAKTIYGTKRVKAIFKVYVDNNGFIEFQGSTQLVLEEEIKKECK
ncbi:MAG TPA: PAS domain-containing protein [Pyrinomonadaceae bacterium]